MKNDDFVKYLKEYRTNMGLTQEEMSELLEISPNNLSKIENEYIKFKTELIIRFLNLLKTDINALINNKNYGQADLYKKLTENNISKMNKRELDMFYDLIQIFLIDGK